MTLESYLLLRMYEVAGDEDLEFYRDAALKFRQVVELYDAEVATMSDEATQKDIEFVTYDIGKRVFGEKNLRTYFMVLYSVLFENTDGPRLGQYIKVLGIGYFMDVLHMRFEHSQNEFAL